MPTTHQLAQLTMWYTGVSINRVDTYRRRRSTLYAYMCTVYCVCVYCTVYVPAVRCCPKEERVIGISSVSWLPGALQQICSGFVWCVCVCECCMFNRKRNIQPHPPLATSEEAAAINLYCHNSAKLEKKNSLNLNDIILTWYQLPANTKLANICHN